MTMTDVRRYLGVSDIAHELGVQMSAVTKWLARYPPEETGSHPFPAPDVRIGTVSGWAPSRLPEIREWRAGMPGRGAGGGRPRTRDQRVAGGQPE
jgi:transposase